MEKSPSVTIFVETRKKCERGDQESSSETRTKHFRKNTNKKARGQLETFRRSDHTVEKNLMVQILFQQDRVPQYK
jgi:hypothetical protein